MKKDKKKLDKIKLLKRLNREENRFRKSGPHKDKREKRQREMKTSDYLAELDDEKLEDDLENI